MKINVSNRVQTKDGDKFVTLLSKKNPHQVSDELGKRLIKEGKAVAAAADAKPSEPVKTGEPVEVKLSSLTVDQLKTLADELGMQGFASLKKDELIAEIQAFQAEEK